MHRRGEEVPLVLPVELRRGAARRRRATDPVDRRDESLLDLLPETTRKPYDMYKLIRSVVDHGEIFDIKPRFARSIITCLARIGGKSVGVVANQPMHLGGILDNDSRRQGRALHPDLRRVQRAARLPPGRARLHGRLEGRARGDHPPRREDAPRDERGDGAEDHGRRAQGVRRRLLRDVRAGVRAGPDRRLADRRRSA